MSANKTYSQRQKQKTLTLVLCAALAVLVVGGLVLNNVLTSGAEAPTGTSAKKVVHDFHTDIVGKESETNPIAVITMQSGEEIVLELYPDKAPNTVANFVELANSGFYDTLTFHRGIPGFMIQGGDPKGNGTGGPGYSIKGEFAQNGFTQNDIKHERGVISMARSYLSDSAGSQFFIMHADAPHLDGAYAAFGRVLSGMETVDAIAAVPTNSNDKPLTAQTIASIRVDTKGAGYKTEKISN